ncbi:SCUBE2 [Branchiostoma lanceolatum]|uniref:SCUBE2 protein n=1 Tax=Branchiostoma lanceolatum TaxID=7740 RepID=A0A8K0AH61_BRALA|nr:SCUBE2 [Branchiostoma lanceolatum]
MGFTILVLLMSLLPLSLAGWCREPLLRIRTRQVTYQIRASQRYYTSCGTWGWSSCTRYRDVYRTGYRPQYYATYYTERVCCTDWTGSNCNTDVDECLRGTDGCSHICDNTAGSYTCRCSPGYSLQSDRHSCRDIDECSSNNGGCEHTCRNSAGSYSCDCNIGFRLNSNDHSCDDINECTEQSSGCEHTCFNSVGSYHCGCYVGWHLAWDQHTCLGNPCVDIGTPQNGERICTGFVTNETCSFECHPGYYMIGSAERSCLPSAQWAGEQPQCPPKLCDRLAPPENGYIRMPCRREYTSRCAMGCNDGFYQSAGDDANKDCMLQDSGVGWSVNAFNCSRK